MSFSDCCTPKAYQATPSGEQEHSMYLKHAGSMCLCVVPRGLQSLWTRNAWVGYYASTQLFIHAVISHVLPIISDVTGNVMVSPTTITLQPKERSATVFATIIDDPHPEDEFTYYVTMNSAHGSRTVNITVHDNDCEYVSMK